MCVGSSSTAISRCIVYFHPCWHKQKNCPHWPLALYRWDRLPRTYESRHFRYGTDLPRWSVPAALSRRVIFPGIPEWLNQKCMYLDCPQHVTDKTIEFYNISFRSKKWSFSFIWWGQLINLKACIQFQSAKQCAAPAIRSILRPERCKSSVKIFLTFLYRKWRTTVYT